MRSIEALSSYADRLERYFQNTSDSEEARELKEEIRKTEKLINDIARKEKSKRIMIINGKEK